MSRVSSFSGVGLAWRIGLVLWAVYLLSYGGGPHAVDEIGQLGVTASLVNRGSFDADELFWTIPAAGNRSDAQVEVGPTGDVWSLRGPGVPLAMAPWYALAMAVPSLDLSFTSLLFNTLLGAVTGGLLVWLGLRLGLSPVGAAAGGLIYGLAGMGWPYAKLGFGEPLIALAVVGAAAAATARRGLAGPALAGAFVALAASTKWSAGALGLPFALQVALAERFCRSRGWRLGALRRVVVYGLVGVAGLGLLGYYNWAHYGSPLATGYGSGGREEFTTPPLYGLFGLLVSSYRGIVWFAPAVLAGALVLPVAYRRAPAVALAAAGVAVVTLATFAAWWTWWGGYTWGPRFLLPICPLLCLMIPLAWGGLSRLAHWVVGALVGLSLLVQLPGVLVDFNPFEKALRDAAPDFPRSGGIWGPAASPILAQMRTLASQRSCALDLTWWHCGHFDPRLLAALLAALVLSGVALWLRTWPLDALALAALVVAIGVELARGPLPPNGPQAELLAAAAARDQLAAPTDGTIVLASPEVPALWAHDRWRGATYGFNRDDLPSVPEAATLLRLALARHTRLWLLASNVSSDDPKNQVERWLEENAFVTGEQSFGGARLREILTGTAAEAPVGASFGAVQLQRAGVVDQTVKPGGVARVALDWTARNADLRGVSVFVHLYDGERLAGQRDGPLARWLPTGADPAHYTGGVGTHFAPLLPERPAGGEITVEVGLYRADGDRLPARDASGQPVPDNRVEIATVAVQP